MSKPHPKKSLYDAYRFPGFTPIRELKGVFGDPKARVLRLNRRSKKQFAGHVGRSIVAGTTKRPDRHEIFPLGTFRYIWSLMFAGSAAGSAKQ